jgi:hypothetical protein
MKHSIQIRETNRALGSTLAASTQQRFEPVHGILVDSLLSKLGTE